MSVSSEEVEMNQAAGAVITPEVQLPVSSGLVMPVSRVSPVSPVSPISPVSNSGLLDDDSLDSGLNAAWAMIVQSVTDRARHNGRTITVDLAEGESAQEFSTRLRMLLLFMNRAGGSVSATVSPSFKGDTYPAMLALVKGFNRAGAGDEWKPDGPRAIRLGGARHLFVSVDMPVADRSPSPDTMLEIVAAHRIDAGWYDQRVRPRASSLGLTTVMFGVPDISGSVYARSIFKRERARNLSGRSGGVHFSRQLDWAAPAAV